MAFDPLSDSTRKYRHGVITVASALIAVQIFQVKITEIPIGGIKIELKDQLIPVALTLSLMYLTISFGVCLVDDNINFGKAPFVDEIIKESSEVVKSGRELLEKYIFDLLKRYIGKEDAQDIANELSGWMFAIDPNPEKRIAEQAISLLERHKNNMVLGQSTFDELIENVIRSFRAARRDFRPNTSSGSALRAYYYFRIFRIYLLEAAFPIFLAAAAFVVRMSSYVTEVLQRLLMAI